MRRFLRLSLVAFPIFLSACASGGSSSVARSSSSVIILEELETVATFSAYDAITRLRPRWLRSRTPGEEPTVFLNGAELGGLESLRSVQASSLFEIRYLNGRDATTRYGTGFGGGAIELRSRR
jgi:hypothetical protein